MLLPLWNVVGHFYMLIQIENNSAWDLFLFFVLMSEAQPVSNIIYKGAIDCYSVSQLKWQLFFGKGTSNLSNKAKYWT